MAKLGAIRGSHMGRIRPIAKFANVFAAAIIALTGCEDGGTLATNTGEGGRCGADKYALWTTGALHGANVYLGDTRDEQGNRQFGDGGLNQYDFADLKAAGANLVVISTAGTRSVASPHQVDDAAQRNLEQAVEWAEAAGLYAVIALRSGPGRDERAITGEGDETTKLETFWTNQQAQTAYLTMLGEIAAKYRDSETVVGIDPIIEPHNSHRVAEDDEQMYDPGEYFAKHGGKVEDINVFYPKATKAIRDAAPTLPILLEPEGWGGVDSLPYLQPTSDDLTVYTVHDYYPRYYTHTQRNGRPYYPNYPGEIDDSDGPAQVDQAAIETRMRQVFDYGQAHDVPIAVTEFGVHYSAHAADGYLADRILAQKPIGSWAVWVWQHTNFEDEFNINSVAASELRDVLVEAWKGNCRRR